MDPFIDEANMMIKVLRLMKSMSVNTPLYFEEITALCVVCVKQELLIDLNAPDEMIGAAFDEVIDVMFDGREAFQADRSLPRLVKPIPRMNALYRHVIETWPSESEPMSAEVWNEGVKVLCQKLDRLHRLGRLWLKTYLHDFRIIYRESLLTPAST